MYFSYDFLNDTVFHLVHFILRTQYVIYVTYKICVNQLFMLLVRLLVNSRLLIVNFLGSQRLYADFLLHRVG